MSRRPPSATDAAVLDRRVGEAFARALAAKDSAQLQSLLAPGLDFQALTPGRHWRSTEASEVVEEIVLAHWFGPGDEIVEIQSVTSDRVGERQGVTYRLRVRREGRDHLVEQHAYFTTHAGRISWMRLLCAGYQLVPDVLPAPAPSTAAVTR
jgi:hypothetical protein